MKDLTDSEADEFAQWFQCLADGTRLRILNLVAGADEPMTVGDIVDAIGKTLTAGSAVTPDLGGNGTTQGMLDAIKAHAQ